ncbi:Dipeptide transport system permease protein DppB [bioreactor metagenome]|uniref:Dipeptide transport system permease protein DppB n=1 Tax=bioreactor metagenome TaxID=1076179 RepID=A0A645E2H9_9ZZZZ
MYHHGLRNILLPAVTLQFGSISELFGGSVLAETVFSYTGLGYVAVVAGTKLDLPLLLGIALCSGFFVFVGNLTANLLYPLIDPQIREGMTHE